MARDIIGESAETLWLLRVFTLDAELWMAWKLQAAKKDVHTALYFAADRFHETRKIEQGGKDNFTQEWRTKNGGSMTLKQN